MEVLGTGCRRLKRVHDVHTMWGRDAAIDMTKTWSPHGLAVVILQAIDTLAKAAVTAVAAKAVLGDYAGISQIELDRLEILSEHADSDLRKCANVAQSLAIANMIKTGEDFAA